MNMSLGMKHRELNLSAPDMVGLLRDVLGKGASFRFKAKGFSMTPIIKDGDIITISPCLSAGLRSGDIAAFTHPVTDCLVVHRIVGIQDGSFFVKGDNNEDLDGLIPGSRILGWITRIERDGRSVQLGLGAERSAIALLSRFHILPLLLAPVRQLYRLYLTRHSRNPKGSK
jgi:signal peptidase I